MAAKGNMFLVGTRILCILISSTYLTSIKASTTVGINTTANDTTSTAAGTTVSETTTEAATTQVQTTASTIPPTTTPPIQTFDPSIVAANVDVGRCWCDITGNACDINCCCDTECDTTDKASFDSCKEAPVSVDSQYCVQEEVILTENSVYTSQTSQDGLFCIYTDNNQQRNYYTTPDMISSLNTFNVYRDRYASYTYLPTTSADTTYSQFYKVGDPIFVVYENSATGYLNIPRGEPYCSSNNPVSYLVDQSFKCTRQLRTLDTATCQTTSYLRASSYLTNVRVVTTPYLFTWIINGTEITTPAPTTAAPPPTTVPTVAVTTSNDTNVTVETTTSTTTTTTAEATTVVLTTVQRSLYNNSYTTEIKLDRVVCLGIDGLVVDCSFAVTSPPDPTFNTTHCNDVVLGVEYHITHDGSSGISSAEVRLTMGSIQTTDLPISQTYGSSFSSVNELNKTITDRSGNPGYITGKPVRAGVLVLNTTGENKYAMIENMYNLTIVKASATGTCLTDSAQREQVNFGVNMLSGCLIRFNLFNVSADQYCQAMQNAVVDAMEGVVDTVTRDDPTRQRRVATYGNSDPLKPGDWVQILRDPPETINPDDSVCSMSMGMSTEILYANTGALANPQPKIIGVYFKYETKQDVIYTCAGSRCTEGNTEVDMSYEVRNSVTFIDVSQPATGYVGEPPVFLAKVPYDFFYPFTSSSSSQIRLFRYYQVVICLLLLCKKIIS
ncbi:tectonic-3-like isoform X2 [Ostrea edulis]|uniref:tectonic-3-like isoform X2 n=1 Tax=Ostrea edulis TaxID=37623 RepID=UPI0024AF4134|nr:tectonic-3-like isoform X2 [Ostrea edulis]